MNKIRFKVSETENLELLSDISIENTTNFDWIKIEFIGLPKYLIVYDTPYDPLHRLKIMLRFALNNELKLPQIIQKNLGYLLNEKIYYMIDQISYLDDQYEAATDFLLWQTAQADAQYCTSTWLYNDKDGNIVFEVTENFKWGVDDDQDHATEAELKSYHKFMKNFQPLVKRIIPLDVARRWLAQAEQLFDLFLENTIKYKANHEQDKKNGKNCC